MNKNGLIFLIVSIIIGILVTWLNTSWISIGGFQSVIQIKKIDYYLSDFTLLVTNSDGGMRYQVKAQHLVHQQATGASEIYKPQLIASENNGANVTLNAQKALQPGKDREILLEGKVSITQKGSDNLQGYDIQTEDLTYNPVDKTLSTDAKISLKSSTGILQGIGLRSKLDDQEIRILSNVHTEYTPAN